MSSRLPAPWGSQIDRDQEISFTFEGKTIRALQGDTIASALLANGQWCMSRSFKYHRPRGPLTMAGQDANTLVQLPNKPNTLADREFVEPDMRVTAQNVTWSLRYDPMSIIGTLSRFLPVGFYYKAFFRPKGIWEWWAKFIRKQAGLGVLNPDVTPPYSDKQYLFCDVAVIGAGPAGMREALSAANNGDEVILIDENPFIGGSFNYARLDDATEKECRSLVEAVNQHSKISVYLNATCNSWHADHWLAVVAKTEEGQRLYKLRAQQVVLSTGSLEQHAVFRGNDIPGVMLGSAAQRALRLYGVKLGNAAVVLAGNNEAYAVALDLLDAGISIEAVIDLRPKPEGVECIDEVIDRGVRVLFEHTVYEARAKYNKLNSVDVRSVVSAGECSNHSQSIECDLLCTSVGFMPTYQLACQAGAQLNYDDESHCFFIDNLPNGMRLAGSVAGDWGGVSDKSELNHSWPIFLHAKGKEFVDFDEDLHARDMINATADGYEHIQLVKRYSTCGMGPSQGRHSALPAARLVAKATGKTVSETGVTTARPPFAAEALSVNAGRSFYPARYTSMHQQHVKMGAQMLQAGAWYRPAYFGSADAPQKAIEAEVKQVRTAVGIVDVSTLGGLDIRGPDAAAFLDRVYTGLLSTTKIGRSKYALLTNEAGVVIDDGVAARFSENHFYVTATTGGVDRVFQTMLKWNTMWGMDVDIANVTSAYCGVNLAGPLSRKVLQKLTKVDIAPDALPYMGVVQIDVAGISARVMRVGFVGELGFEIHVPQLYGHDLYKALLDAGAEFDIKPFGIEAQRVLRLEKGHVIIGQDTDAMTTPYELQMSWAVAKKKPFFLGSRTLQELKARGDKRVLVGFTYNPCEGQPKESHLVVDNDRMVGRITSAAYSPTLNTGVGLTYVDVEVSNVGRSINVKVDRGKKIVAKIVDLPFYDPQSQRQDVL